MKKTITLFLTLMFVVATALSVSAQPWPYGPGPRPPFGPGPYGPRPPYGPPPPPPHHHHGPSDFDKAMGIVGTVGAIAAMANGQSVYSYNRYGRSVVVVDRPPVVVQRPPIVVEKPVVIEKPVIIEKPVPVAVTNANEYYSRKLGATFGFEKMQIPGYKFVGARLLTEPVNGSPLYELGLRRGDVVTRLDNDPASSADALELHEKVTTIRYIKTGTTKVLIDRIYIPTDDELQNAEDDGFVAP